MTSETSAVETEGLHAYTPDRPLLLLTDYPPDAAGGGGVILRDLLGPLERERVVWASPTPGGTTLTNGLWLRSGTARSGRRSIGLDSTLKAGTLAREVEQVARDRQARAVWIVMHGAAVGIAARLVRRGSLPVHLTVHDDPAFANALRSRRYLPLVPWIERDFAASLRGARSVDVISDAMARRYERRYGVRSVVVHRGLSGPIEPSPPYRRPALRVGVLGSTYSYEQLPALGRAVASAASQLGVAGEMVVMGRSYGERLREEMRGQIEVEVTGHVDEADAVPILRGCFALYLNYPFGWRDAVLRQTSFPTKLSTYVQTARPILIHAPADSSVMPLVGADGYAAHWGSRNEANGAATLVDLWRKAASHESQHCAAEAVRLRYYDRSKNRRTLFKALDALVS
jgi:glycosyltransferase involved in cell wall biosynthesis